MTVTTTLLVGLSGALGAAARFVLDGLVRSRWPTTIPLATMLINISGAFLLGLLTGLWMAAEVATGWRDVLGVGFLGGYTTFSTAMVETVHLRQHHHAGLAAANLLIMIAACGFAAFLGLGFGAPARF
ncbi:fluoride efflux transporter FluC [Nonomuraea gerenzanensis]|uniref:Fluoride-specific ion channel FluC n=1 Tax=Nonomuraea gerenzanensis TaxID=93944 RepID=A0A1M4ECR2_9ACTN|nr:CrcB family protein [Nonomuraea gerenzanensis]UBU08433.1 CrcB family protein [Nonomuraea gerenzanensis]SBO96777.1 CrcB protein [Nonomuraea gerenzanensis]